jgi:hypothetical protein
LTSNHLKIKKVTPARCGPVKLCCCYEYSINNIDLSKVNDVDVYGEPAPWLLRTFCFAVGKEHIEIQTPSESEGKLSLIVEQGQGDRVSGLAVGSCIKWRKRKSLSVTDASILYQFALLKNVNVNFC